MMLFDILIFAMVAGAYTLWGVSMVSTYYENTVYADCDLQKGLLIGKHKFILKAYSDFNHTKHVNVTNKICFNQNCIEDKQDILIYDYEKYISKPNYTFYDLPKLKPGYYVYKVTTDIEGYTALHAEKLCSFTIR